ncbi:MAG TPA: chromosome segregation protein SMC [Bacteroidota bacterium]|nr:chromosome segregation protein SMC [Bacteroidota bacterium]
MYLSKIEIIGFKSFAQRINLQFDSGVTAIVGPNGCGKTNIVDAIRWALGEQRYSTLRSDKMEDVIFNGTKNRKALGLAEVSLTIENTRGILPTEYSEVTITRRVFRSGESEYMLNKVPCRLKDIIDLFMDTGMGSDAYSVIELKMVETILSDKTDERRKLFEEAAGVTKYKHRRKAALRKLDEVRLDLARVNDIVKEVQKTVGSLERQSKKAEQYNEVSTRLKTLEIDLLEREYAYLEGKLKPLDQKFHLASTDKTNIDAELRKQEEYIDRLREQLGAIESELSEVQQASSLKFDEIRRVEEKILVANERRSSLESNIKRYESECADLTVQQKSLGEETELLKDRSQKLHEEHATSEGLFSIAQAEEAVAAEALEAKKRDVQQCKDTILRIAHEIVQKRGEQERLKGHIDNSQGRIDRSEEDSAEYRSDIGEHEKLIAEFSSQDRELRRRFAEAEVGLFEAEQKRKEFKRDLDGLQKKILDIANEIERKKSKAGFLQRVIESNEGYSEGVRYLLNQESWRKKKLTTVADVLHVRDEYRPGIEVALGEAAQMLVVDTVDDGYHAVEELRSQGKGKVSFISLQWVPRIRSRKRRGNSTFVWATDVVQCEEKYRPLVFYLLSDVVFVNSLENAGGMMKKSVGLRCLTADGQWTLTTGGVLRGGGHQSNEIGILGKKSQIEELDKEIALLEQEEKDLRSRYAKEESVYQGMENRAYVEAVKSLEKEMTGIEMRIAQLEFEKKRANDGIERNKIEIELLQHDILDQQVQYDRVAAELVSFEEHKSAQDQLLQNGMREHERLEMHWNEKTRARNELERKVVTLQGDVRNVDRDIERATARANDISVTLQRREEEILHAGEEIGRLSSEITLAESESVGLKEQHRVIESRHREIDSTHTARRNELHQIELRIKDERRLHDDAVAHTHDLEMKIAELKSNIEHLLLRAKEEFELELQLKPYPEDEWVDFAQLREEVKNLKDRIRVLGAINFAAFDEFTTESQRLNFLTQQRDDLLEAEQTLINTIEEINATAQRMFLETFDKIRQNFITTFKELFLEGDECDLRLEENVDPLEANIEITAKPRGKRPTSIDLLSGGEKTLTAIALLFAIYLVKPSPFCILDEVDAPLDDSNIDRFTRILKKFSGNTQFIVVTHNKRTMEAAQALYGVTMEEQGVSKIVTVRFNEEARVRSATVTN